MSVKYIYQWLSEFLTMAYWTNFWISMHRCFGKFLWKSTIEAGSNYHSYQNKNAFGDESAVLIQKFNPTLVNGSI